MLEQVNAMPPMSQGTVEAARKTFRRMSMMGASLAPPAEVESAEDITVPGAEGDLPARLYRPSQAGPLSPTIVFFHGGGFVIGDIASYDGQCRILCSEVEAAVLSVEYRLAPDHGFPAAAEDAIAVARWALENVARLGGDPERMVLGGDSAGGNLAAVAAQATRASKPGYAAQLLLYPVTDLSDSDRPSHRENAEGLLLTEDDMNWFRSLYAGDGPFDDPRLSPLFAEDLSGLPPALVITAELDPLRDDGEAYGDALTAAGVEVIRRRYDGLIHGFFAMGALSNAAGSAVDEICADLRKLLG